MHEAGQPRGRAGRRLERAWREVTASVDSDLTARLVDAAISAVGDDDRVDGRALEALRRVGVAATPVAVYSWQADSLVLDLGDGAVELLGPSTMPERFDRRRDAIVVTDVQVVAGSLRLLGTVGTRRPWTIEINFDALRLAAT